ncbi:ubiquitin carboxyl-terminal hydrolase 8 [Citrus sinensis]|uniref:Ubiquitin carboxyl-terminal hydrolase 8 n=1 Tax=Citrus sinensis TaxID=2711 RepID=A0ACB8K1K6_CITSI|nr:ubiquitin carboxyl-terminal hydrolase 8 [Citrus sinensis]
MTRLAEKLQLSLLLTRNTTRFLSRVSLSTLRLCKSLLSKTLAGLFSAMDHDYPFSSEGDDHLFEFDYSNSSRQNNYFSQPTATNSRGLFDDDDRQKVYLVPYRWWKESQILLAEKVGGVLYEVLSNDDNTDLEILLHLKKKEGSVDSDCGEGGVSVREYALVPEGMWLRALKWHNDSKAAVKDFGSSFAADEQDVFPLQIRLSVSQETNSLLVKISLEDNKVDLYKRACNLFISVSEMLYIWDFSGQTTQFLMHDGVSMSDDFSGKPGEEVFLQLQVHGFSDSVGETNDEMAEPYKIIDSICNGSVKINGSNDNLNSYITSSNSVRRGSGNGGVCLLGLTGLRNLGNTCFMNSAIQCLAHTPEIVDYFLGDYQKEINYENPLGLNGELALAFGDLLRKLWAPGGIPVAPRMFKLKLANFAPQFSGYNQHDSQEFLAFLLDGLHEDLNRVKCKPYLEAKDAEGQPEEEVAEEYWRNHRARNDSIIVDLCQVSLRLTYKGQYRSMLVCPVCNKVSVTFDPLMYLSLPIPSTTMRTMTVTVLSTDGSTMPAPFTVTVPKYGRFQDLIDALSTKCFLRNHEKLLVAEIYRSKIFRVLDEPSDLLGLIRDEDKLVAYRLPKDSETPSLVLFMHERKEESCHLGRLSLEWKIFGTPLVGRLSDLTNGSDIRKLFLKLLDPFLMPVGDDSDFSDEAGKIDNGDSIVEDVTSSRVSDNDAVSDSSEAGDEPHLSDDFQFYRLDSIRPTEIKMNEPLSISDFAKPLTIHVQWAEKMIEKYDTCLLSSLMEVCKPQLFTRMPPESVSLYKCLEAFLKEEPLGPEDMWYCPRCKKHWQASKKLDLWRSPDILVIHLKRFSFSRYFKSKLDTYVDFPIDDLDLSNYVCCKNSQLSNRYVLYAISNHYGGMGGGHYTAFVDLGHKRWFEFDDDRVYPVSEDNIKTSAAYVLFYKRVSDVK